jgi:hypothetical protein
VARHECIPNARRRPVDGPQRRSAHCQWPAVGRPRRPAQMLRPGRRAGTGTFMSARRHPGQVTASRPRPGLRARAPGPGRCGLPAAPPDHDSDAAPLEP